MVEAAPQQALLHAVFLRRLADASAGSASPARLGHGAFLTLRLVDLLEPAEPRARPDAFGYQLAAMDRVCRELPGDSIETAHLVGLMQAAADAYRARDAQLVVPALLAYAHYLEDELLLNEALDVLDTVLRVGGDALRSSDRLAGRLRAARVLRKLNEFDAAEEAYKEAGTLAVATGDRRSESLSRIGRARATMGRGNLAVAEDTLRDVLANAEGLGDRDILARVHQELSIVLSARGQPIEGIPHAWQAYSMYDDEVSRARVLGDLAGMLLITGDAVGAEHALAEVIRSGATQDVISNALIEMMHCASYRQDRLGFERWRDQCEARREQMPPSMLADFYLKSGIGRARFGQFDRARVVLRTALEVAEGGGLHELAFRIDRIRAGLRDCQEVSEPPGVGAAEPASHNEGVREVSTSLAHLRTQ